MQDGFLKVSTITTPVRPADVEYNVSQIIAAMKAEFKKHTKIAVFPALCITGATCGDLFAQKALIDAAEQGLVRIAQASRNHDTLIFVGLPVTEEGETTEAIAVVQDGEILAVIRDSANDVVFSCVNMEGLTIAVDFGDGDCEDAVVVVQPVAEPELVDTDEQVALQMTDDSSARLCAILRANAGAGESTTDEVYAGYNLIAEAGRILAHSIPFTTGAVTTEIDVEKLYLDRARAGCPTAFSPDTEIVDFGLRQEVTKLTREIKQLPFVPAEPAELRLERILKIQSAGLQTRMQAIGCERVILGISGGLDSTCALIVCALTMDAMGLPRKNIHAVTMPCFGTSNRTKNNALELMKRMGCTTSAIDISEAVALHLRQIGHKLNDYNVTYENAQARERTQILMDLANDENALVVGTGDLSEIALGWCTYNGDHMSSYSVNASVPKTLMRHLVRYYGEICKDRKLKALLTDVINTPVSPELLPPVKGEISQKTEEKIGPYELHDFFLYYFVRCGFAPSKIFRLAKYAWGKVYTDAEIFACLETFIRKFFASQFKRSCMPDGPKVGTVDLSPRGEWKMPSDASRTVWLNELYENVRI